MDNHKDKLHILGKVSSVVIKKLQENNLPANAHAVWLFVGYSFAGYKVGDSFDIFIREADQRWHHHHRIRLLKIRDEFGRNYSSIPEGYKTMCLFDCRLSIPPYVRQLSTLKTWQLTDRSLYICNHADIDLLSHAGTDTAVFNALAETVVFNLRKKHKKVFSMRDVAGVLPKDKAQFIIDNLLLAGTLKKIDSKLVLSE